MMLLCGIGVLLLTGARTFARPALPRLDVWHGWLRMLWNEVSATRRSRALVRAVLTEREYRHLTRRGYLEVSSPSNRQRVYRIPGKGGLVRVYDRGTAVMDLCLQPAEPLPDGDVVLLHKLMIEGDEQEYLARANHFAPGGFLLRR